MRRLFYFQKPANLLLILLTLGLGLTLNLDETALARSSGGRSRGGSFRQSPSRSSGGSPSQNSPSQPSRPSGQPVPVYPAPYNPGYGGGYGGSYGGGYGGGYSSSASTGSDMTWLWWIAGALGFTGLAWWMWASFKPRKVEPGSFDEINNQIVSVTEVQMALLANSPIQKELTEIVQTMAIETPAQLKEQFQTVVVSLLRLPEFWSHALVNSQTFPNRAEAEGYFEQWSVKQRSNLTQETLTRDSLGLRERELTVNPEDDPAAYVVVSLLIGTTHDRPLVDKVYASADLKAALEKLSAISEEELLVFEFIWTPQDASDSLSRDELLTEFGNLVMV